MTWKTVVPFSTDCIKKGLPHAALVISTAKSTAAEVEQYLKNLLISEPNGMFAAQPFAYCLRDDAHSTVAAFKSKVLSAAGGMVSQRTFFSLFFSHQNSH